MHHKGLNPSLSRMESVFWIQTGPNASGLICSEIFQFLLIFCFHTWDFRSFGLAFRSSLRSRSTARPKLVKLVFSFSVLIAKGYLLTSFSIIYSFIFQSAPDGQVLRLSYLDRICTCVAPRPVGENPQSKDIVFFQRWKTCYSFQTYTKNNEIPGPAGTCV